MFLCLCVSVRSNMRTGVKTNQTTSSPEERTAWWWSPTRMANGTTSPATTTCPTSARREQVRTARWMGGGATRRVQQLQQVIKMTDRGVKRRRGTGCKTVMVKKRKELRGVKHLRCDREESDRRRRREPEEKVMEEKTFCSAVSSLVWDHIRSLKENHKIEKKWSNVLETVFFSHVKQLVSVAAGFCWSTQTDSTCTFSSTYLSVSCFTLHTSLPGGRD